MSKRHQVPACKLHKPSGQARVIIDGKHCYLGRFGTAESKGEYARLVAEWSASGSATPAAVTQAPDLRICERIKFGDVDERIYVRFWPPLCDSFTNSE